MLPTSFMKSSWWILSINAFVVIQKYAGSATQYTSTEKCVDLPLLAKLPEVLARVIYSQKPLEVQGGPCRRNTTHSVSAGNANPEILFYLLFIFFFNRPSPGSFWNFCFCFMSSESCNWNKWDFPVCSKVSSCYFLLRQNHLVSQFIDEFLMTRWLYEAYVGMSQMMWNQKIGMSQTFT